MSHDVLLGTDWSLEVRENRLEINIFGARSKNCNGSWSISSPGSFGWMKIWPTRASAKIANALEEALDAGMADRICTEGVSTDQAVVLFLEGALEIESLLNSEESTGKITAAATIEGVLRELEIRQEQTQYVRVF